MSSREEALLPHVIAHLSVAMQRDLRRMPELSHQGPTPDLCTEDAGPYEVLEVKELVPASLLELLDASADHGHWTSTSLLKRWQVCLFEDSLDGRLPPIPDFPPDPSPEEVTSLADAGFTVVSRDDRIAEHIAEAHLGRRDTVRVKTLAHDLEPHLRTLEVAGISSTRGDLPEDVVPDGTVLAALHAIRERSGGALCMSRDPGSEEPAGVEVLVAYGHARTGDPHVVAQRVQLWLNSKESGNLTASLAGATADRRHAVLWLSTDGEQPTANELRASFLPTEEMELPTGVDTLWVFLEPVLLRYDEGIWEVLSTTVGGAAIGV